MSSPGVWRNPSEVVAMTGAVPSVFHYGRPPYRLGLARNKKREINTPPTFGGLLFLSFGGVRALEARGGGRGGVCVPGTDPGKPRQ